MKALRYAVALVVVVDFLVAVVQMQQAIIERASFRPLSVTTYGQYAVTMDGTTPDDIDLYVRDPNGDIAWYGGLQSGPLSLEHDTIPGVTDPVTIGERELTVIRESTPGEYVVNCQFYTGNVPATMTVTLWDLRGNDRQLFQRKVTLTRQGQQVTAFRFELNSQGDYTGHNLLPADLLTAARGGQ